MRVLGLVILMSVAWLLAMPAMAQTKVALVIGNGAYRHTAPLRNPVNDARDITAALRAAPLNFDVDVVENADLDQMNAALRRFSEKARRASIALFFYAGHGMQAASPDRRGQSNWLLPVSTRARREADLPSEALMVESVINAMHGARAMLVILDACRNNPLAAAMEWFDGNRGSGTRGLTPVALAQPNQLVAYSTRPGTTADDGSGRNSPFTQHLLRHIVVPGVEVRAMLQNVRRDVWEATRKQFPMNEDLLVEPVYLVPVVGLVGPVPPPPMPPSPTPDTTLSSTQAVAAVPVAPTFVLRALTLDEIIVAQRHLMQLGYDTGVADGIAGPRSRYAMARFAEVALRPDETAFDTANQERLSQTLRDFLRLTERGATSPRGIASATVTGAAARVAQAQRQATDYEESVYWYGLAGREHDNKALAQLGRLLMRGNSVTRDPVGGSLLLRLAASRGDSAAAFDLGMALEQGLTLGRNVSWARWYYDQADRLGHAQAQEALKRLGS